MNEWFKLCPKCGEKQVYTEKYTLKKSIEGNKWCNKCRGKERKILIPENGWTKLCPLCGKEQKYSCKSSLTNAIKKNKICEKCQHIKCRKHNGIFERICRCGKVMAYTCRQGLNISKKRNAVCRYCATKESAKHIDRSFQKTKEYREKMSISLKSSLLHKKIMKSEKIREKLRIAKLNQIKEKGTKINFNLIACQFIDNFGKQNGFSFQHAMNGGEISIAGYSLDGYDKEKNIVFEYDEPKHNILSVSQKDRIREKIIIEKIHPAMFIRYNEEFDKLYDVISGKELI